MTNKHISLKKYIDCAILGHVTQNLEFWFQCFRWEISGFCLLSFCQNERFLSFLSLYIFEESVFIFQFLNDKMHNYVKQNIIVYFIIQKLKNKRTFLKNIQTEKAEEPLILTGREETKTIYFVPKPWDKIHMLFIGYKAQFMKMFCVHVEFFNLI